MYTLSNGSVLAGGITTMFNSIRSNVMYETRKLFPSSDPRRSSVPDQVQTETFEKAVISRVLKDMGFSKESISDGIQLSNPTLQLARAVASDHSLTDDPLQFLSDPRIQAHLSPRGPLLFAGTQFACAPLQIQRRGFKTIKSKGYTGLGRTVARKSMADGASDEKPLLKDLLSAHGDQPDIQKRLIESYRRGMESTMNILKEERESSMWKSWFRRITNAAMAAIVLVLLFNLLRSFQDPSKAGIARFMPEKWELTEEVRVNFSDVKGCDEAKKELEDVVEFLRKPAKFNRLGARLPKGVLLVGGPGVGKTLLARAVAGEAKVPFLHVSGSEFDEMFVGTGAARVRKLFESAKAKAPCVIFIDEIDAVGGKRVSSPVHPYANQTINQLLSEMDGFKPSEGIIVLGATNRKTHLDHAILRPGRFDMEVQVRYPDFAGRKAIFKLYLEKVKVVNEMDLDALAKGTTRFTGADIQNMVNQAAITAGLRGTEGVTMELLWYARDKIIMGPARSRTVDEELNTITAYHEAGHALVAYYTPECDPLHKVTIIPRGDSLGHTSVMPEKDVGLQTRARLNASMDMNMGGRVAEELIYGPDKVTTGASSDFRNATNIAEQMVKAFGMSEKVGVRYYPDNSRDTDNSEISGKFLEGIDEEVQRILSESYERAKKILTAHAKEHKALTDALLQYETLDREDMISVINGGLPKDAQKKAKEAAEKEESEHEHRSAGFLNFFKARK